MKFHPSLSPILYEPLVRRALEEDLGRAADADDVRRQVFGAAQILGAVTDVRHGDGIGRRRLPLPAQGWRFGGRRLTCAAGATVVLPVGRPGVVLGGCRLH